MAEADVFPFATLRSISNLRFNVLSLGGDMPAGFDAQR